MRISKKHSLKISLLFTFGAILFFQLKKRNTRTASIDSEKHAVKKANSEYAKLILQRSIYYDSIYKIYIANINERKELVFIKKGRLSAMQNESKFFVHIYPLDTLDLVGKANHNPLNFKSNFTSFFYKEEEYHVARTILPDYKIEKLNLGQYAFRGDNTINYKTENLIYSEHIGKILKENGEDMPIFECVEDTF